MARLIPTGRTGALRALLLAVCAAWVLVACAPEEEEETAAAEEDEAAEASEDGGEAAAEADGEQDGEGGLRIGALMPMTGDLQAYGETSLNGARLAVQQVNAGGGVHGSEVELLVGDTQTTPQAGIDAAQQLVSVDGVHGIVGALSSGVTIPVAQSVTSEEGVVQISPASTSPVITGLEDDDYLFRSVPSDAFQGVALAELIAEDGLEAVSVLYINNDYGEGLADSFAEAFEAKGGDVRSSQAYEGGSSSYRGELSNAADEEAEALLLIGYPENGITILRQAVEGGHFDRFVFSDGMKAPSVIESVGADVLEGAYGTAPQALEDSDAATRFSKGYEEAFGERPPQPFIDTAYDAAFVIALAAEAAGSRDRSAIRDELRAVANAPGEEILPGQWSRAVELLEAGEDINYTGASGSIEFDDAGDVTGTFAHWVIEDGEIVTERVFEPSME